VKICCALGIYLLKKEETEAFFNTIAHWSMTVRQFLRNSQTLRAFVAAFTSEKRMMTIKKVHSAIGHC
jgi:hypothetical protein